MTPPANELRLIGHKARFAEAITQIDAQLDYESGAVVAARRDEVVAAARSAYGPSDDFRGIRDAWDAGLSRWRLQRKRIRQSQRSGVVAAAMVRARGADQGSRRSARRARVPRIV